jgi:hypothetical protein
MKDIGREERIPTIWQSCSGAPLTVVGTGRERCGYNIPAMALAQPPVKEAPKTASQVAIFGALPISTSVGM